MEKKINDYLLIEQWKKVSSYRREYYISDHGRIKGSRKITFGAKNNYGYMRASLWNGEKYIFVMVHRLVAETFIANPQNKPDINHKNGIKHDNNASNLEWVTVSENAIHAYATGLRKAHPVVGENNYGSKLTEVKVREIRSSLLSQKKLAALYNISSGVIQRIKQNKTWKHVI